MKRRRIVHVINCLSVGGAERMLVRLVAATDGTRFETHVVTLLDMPDRATLRPELLALGTSVRTCGLDARRPGPRAVIRLRHLLRELHPDVIQSWLYHANAAAALVRPTLGFRPALVWNIRQSVADLASEPRGIRTAIRLNAWLSRSADAIVNNSARSAEDHRRLGFRPRREEIVPNGLDVAGIAHGAEARSSARDRLGLEPHALVVGSAGRFHPMKDHLGLLESFAPIARRREDAVLVLVGRGVDDDNAILREAIEALALPGRVRLLGERLDLPALYAAMDCFVSSSARGEGFPNVVAEAMAAGVPVVATDVGDTAELVGDAGAIAPPSDRSALTSAIDGVLALPPADRRALGRNGRARIVEDYGISTVARRYEAIWDSFVADS